MRPSRRPLIIATRNSRLARAQAEAVARALRALHPRIDVSLLPVTTEGDRILDRPLSDIGGKGLFTRAIESALLSEKADLAVHSLKDLPTRPTAGLVLAAFPKRGDPRDALITPSAQSIDDLPHGASIGTSSQRRAAQLLARRSDLQIHGLRGNVDTRLRRVLTDGRFDATLLATAGLQRGGFDMEHAHPIPTDQLLPAPGQAALALQCRAADHVTLRRCLPLNDAVTALCVECERKVVHALAADCTSPIAVFAEAVEPKTLRLRAQVLSHDGSRIIEADTSGPTADADTLTQTVIDQMLTDGARELIRQQT